jgi:hypothetical protein
MSNLERMNQLDDAHRAATGAPHPLFASARATGDAEVIDAAISYFERSTPAETIALSAVARELTRNASPPELYLLVDVAATPMPQVGSLEDAMRASGAIHAAWKYLRLPPTTHREHAIAARILLPEKSNASRHIEAASRIFMQNPQWRPPVSDAKAALLRRAVEADAAHSATATPKRKVVP